MVSGLISHRVLSKGGTTSTLQVSTTGSKEYSPRASSRPGSVVRRYGSWLVVSETSLYNARTIVSTDDGTNKTATVSGTSRALTQVLTFKPQIKVLHQAPDLITQLTSPLRTSLCRFE